MTYSEAIAYVIELCPRSAERTVAAKAGRPWAVLWINAWSSEKGGPGWQALFDAVREANETYADYPIKYLHQVMRTKRKEASAFLDAQGIQMPFTENSSDTFTVYRCRGCGAGPFITSGLCPTCEQAPFPPGRGKVWCQDPKCPTEGVPPIGECVRCTEILAEYEAAEL